MTYGTRKQLDCITYTGCLMLWKTQLQTEITLLNTENVHTETTYELYDAMPIMALFKEMKEQYLTVTTCPNCSLKGM